nr:MAG TPA: hypothetical protein [Caudoviricetes sp.]
MVCLTFLCNITKNLLNFLQVTIFLCIFATSLMFSSAKIRKVLQACKLISVFEYYINFYYLTALDIYIN